MRARALDATDDHGRKVPVATLRKRARWILLLAELQERTVEGQLRERLEDGSVVKARGEWVTRSDWIRVGGWAIPQRWENSAPHRDLYRLRGWLEDECGIAFTITTELSENRIFVSTRELVDLVALELRRARVLEELARARREGDEAQLGPCAPPCSNLQSLYQDEKKPFSWLCHRHGLGKGRLRRLLEIERVKIRRPGRMAISELVGPERTARALKVHDEGGSLEDVRRELGLATKASARRFLERNGRDTRPREERSPPA